LSKRDCCAEHFPNEISECKKNSPNKPGETDEDQQQEIDEKVQANPARFKYHYFPSFGTVACLRNTYMDAPDYMLDSPDSFLFLSMDICCSVSFDIEYRDCVRNSKLAEIEEPYGEDMLDDTLKEPHLLLKFGGKLYFRNVFIPSSTPKNMRIIRDAVLHAVKVNMEPFVVVQMVGVNFDGVDLVGLDDFLAGSRQRQLANWEEDIMWEVTKQETDSTDDIVPSVDVSSSSYTRKLQRMQLYRFTMAISMPCDRSCIIDMSSAGRSASFDISDVFDDAMHDNSIFVTLSQDMEGMGLIGPFSGATLDEGFLQYDGVEWDKMYTWTPTISPKPTDKPTKRPTASRKPTKKPTRRPTGGPTDRPTRTNPYYPDGISGTCLKDGKQSEFQFSLYDSLEECVSRCCYIGAYHYFMHC